VRLAALSLTDCSTVLVRSEMWSRFLTALSPAVWRPAGSVANKCFSSPPGINRGLHGQSVRRGRGREGGSSGARGYTRVTAAMVHGIGAATATTGGTSRWTKTASKKMPRGAPRGGAHRAWTNSRTSQLGRGSRLSRALTSSQAACGPPPRAVGGALPLGTALGSHPLMEAKTGSWGIADFDLVTDEIELGSGMGTAKIVRPASEAREGERLPP